MIRRLLQLASLTLLLSLPAAAQVGGRHGSVDPKNSSTATLLGSATFTGSATDVRDVATVTVAVDTDQDGTLYLEFSQDGTNWDRSKEIDVDQDIGSGSVHSLSVGANWFRVRYVNGSTDQTHFRLQTLLHASRPNFLVSSPNQIISRIDDVQLTRPVTEFIFDVCRGTHADRFCVSKFGSNSAVGSVSFEDIWTEGGVYPWPTAAETVRVAAGGNAADTAAGAGARSITVEGLDETWMRASETVVTAGASASSATTTFIRVFRCYSGAAGAYGAPNTGDVEVENTSSTNVLCEVAAGVGQSELALYTVPEDYDAYLTFVDFEVDGTQAAEVRMFQRRDADDVTVPFAPARLVHRALAVTGAIPWTPGVWIQFPEKTDLWISAQSAASSTAINARFDLVLVKNNPLAAPQ